MPTQIPPGRKAWLSLRIFQTSILMMLLYLIGFTISHLTLPVEWGLRGVDKFLWWLGEWIEELDEEKLDMFDELGDDRARRYKEEVLGGYMLVPVSKRKRQSGVKNNGRGKAKNGFGGKN